jgi:hypothetical protein
MASRRGFPYLGQRIDDANLLPPFQSKRSSSVSMRIFLTLLLLLGLFQTAAAAGRTFHVDAQTGNDRNNLEIK